MELQKNADWYQYLDKYQKELIEVGFSLLEKKDCFANINDFSFIVFPMSKAYEGFLKKVFYDMGLINKTTYEGKRFRIGRALNPDIRKDQRDEYWLYDDVALKFGHDEARQLWDTWLICRNRVFHYFSNFDQFLTYSEANKRVQMIVAAIQLVSEKIKTKK